MAGDVRDNIGSINASILVARTMARTSMGADPSHLESLEATARYCQLLAARMKLYPLEAHRLVLAVWLSAFKDRPDVAERLGANHYLDELAEPSALTAEARRTAAEILSLVKTYQVLESADKRIGCDIVLARKCLDKLWCTTPARGEMLKKFVRLLKDESFLDDCDGDAGRVLIVDPEESVTPMLSSPLRNDGYEVTVIPSVADAWAALPSLRPDIILCAREIPITCHVSH